MRMHLPMHQSTKPRGQGEGCHFLVTIGAAAEQRKCRYGCATHRRKSPSKLSRNPLPSHTCCQLPSPSNLISDAALTFRNFTAVWNRCASRPPPYSQPRWRPSAGIRVEGLTFSPLISPEFSAATSSLTGATSDLFFLCYQQRKHDEANEDNPMTPLETHPSHFHLKRRLFMEKDQMRMLMWFTNYSV